MEFYFDIKGRKDSDGDSFSKWAWPPVWSGRIEAEDSKDARRKIEEEYNRKFILKDGKNCQDHMFLLSIKPMSPYLAKRFEKIQCTVCDTDFTANEAYIIGLNDARFCSVNCKKEFDANLEMQKLSNNNVDFNNYRNPPVIYCIKNIQDNKVYIGKSVRSFTLRWWEHIKVAKVYDNASSKFHVALRNSSLSDWEFKVIEVIVFPDTIMSYTDKDRHILERETHWMKQLDSIDNGYNSLESIKKEADKLQIQISF
jgi:hypothetical protein